MKKKDKPPLIQVTVTERGIRPLTSEDAERIITASKGIIYDLVPTSKRSNKQLRTYWKALGLVVKATHKWATAENLHRDIKTTLGYCEKSVNIRTGEIHLIPDSIALESMENDEFNGFMMQAMKLLADTLGFDPLSFLDEAA